jgi:hypothetical protein
MQRGIPWFAADGAAKGDPQGATTWVKGVNPRFTILTNTDHGGVQEKTRQIPGLREWFYAQLNKGNILTLQSMCL